MPAKNGPFHLLFAAPVSSGSVFEPRQRPLNLLHAVVGIVLRSRTGIYPPHGHYPRENDDSPVNFAVPYFQKEKNTPSETMLETSWRSMTYSPMRRPVKPLAADSDHG